MTLAWILLFLPFAVAVVCQLVLRKSALVPLVSTASALVTLVLALLLLGKTGTTSFDWATIGDFHLQIGIQLDQLSTGMMIVVTGVGALVHVFSLAYMKDDEAKARYFTGLSFFMFSMTGIVLAIELHHDLHLLGTGRIQFLSAHRPLVSEGKRRRRREKSLPLQPRRRLRLHDRHPHAVGHHRHPDLRAT